LSHVRKHCGVCRVPKLLLPSEVGGKQGRGNDSDRGRRHRLPRFLSIPGSTSTVSESTMLETVWIDKDTFQFSAVA
jgi:hypothetical protein